MRDILFRGKKDNGEWAYGYVVPTTTNVYDKGVEIIEPEGIEYDELDGFRPSFSSDSVDPETVGQFTGITDKKGNRIFEGDVLSSMGRNKTTVLLIVNDIRKCTNLKMWVDGMNFAVTGNIHDNPEFMKAYEDSLDSGGLVTWED